MKKSFVVLLYLIFIVNTSLATEIKVLGIFQGENLFVMNPFASTGVGFCVYEVTVNGEITTDEINSSAFEIDLSVFNLKIGQQVVIIIKHKENCIPKVLNPEVLKPKSTYKVLDISINKKSKKLKWVVSGEKGVLPYIVEHYKWRKWINVATVKGKGVSGTHTYSVSITPVSGNNRFRVKQVDYSRKPRYSPEVTYRSLAAPVTFSPSRPKNEIKFSEVTSYEIYDFYGKLVKKGRSDKVNISRFKKGNYFLNFDNEMGKFTKK
ncbi:MAG: hypothetical protein B6I20_07485 [Bacteroidetes bacterium 4572_117]|nr:MAG: hypothetical protein B6I20_07485 [Bacteroidetes bacterium 4572_117]